MAQLLNRVRHVTATTGTGAPIALGAAVAKYQTVEDAGGVDGTEYAWLIEDGVEWELFTGIWSLSGNEVDTRNTVQSSNGGSAINLSGNAEIAIVARAEEITTELANDTTPQLGGDLDAQGNDISDLGNVTFQTGAAGGTLRTGTSAADKFVLQAYDVNDATYRTVIELDAGNDVVLQVIGDYTAIEDAADTTKHLEFDLSGATTATATTLAVSQTAARTITLPDATDTLVGKATTDTLSNKTFPNTGLHILDTNASHDLIVKPGSDLTADRTLTITTGDADRTLTINGDATVSANTAVDAIEFVIDGGGSAITTGVKGYLEIPYGCTIDRVTLLADQSGSIVVDIWKDTYANYPPTDADSITASAVPTISAATKSQDATLTGWTTSISAGDILGFNVDSASTVTRVTVSLKVTKA